MEIRFLFKKIWRLLAFIGVLYVSSCLLLWHFELGVNDSINNVWDVLWYGIVTLSTVGYGDISPVSTGGRIVGGVLVIFTLTTVGFMISVISDAVIETKEREALGINGTKFKDHIIICGWSEISRVALLELLVAGHDVAVITENQDMLPKIRDLGSKKHLFVTYGDPTENKILQRVNLETARVVLVATETDTKNLIVSINAKHLNPKARIIVTISREELKSTMTVAGVTYVASPYELSGRLAASAAFEPEVALFIDDITSAADDEDDEGYDMQQFSMPENTSLANISVQQFRKTMEEKHGPLLVGVGMPKNGTYEIVPHPDPKTTIRPGMVMLVLGNPSENEMLSQMLGVKQGR